MLPEQPEPIKKELLIFLEGMEDQNKEKKKGILKMGEK